MKTDVMQELIGLHLLINKKIKHMSSWLSYLQADLTSCHSKSVVHAVMNAVPNLKILLRM